mmetsp:Transcript_47754/g.110628  ORF Transcript_47754/g.110628 Transcript_47754/m.110628 type:complete len:225 (+) Transcript_47754:957-1631(+)
MLLMQVDIPLDLFLQRVTCNKAKTLLRVVIFDDTKKLPQDDLAAFPTTFLAPEILCCAGHHAHGTHATTHSHSTNAHRAHGVCRICTAHATHAAESAKTTNASHAGRAARSSPSNPHTAANHRELAAVHQIEGLRLVLLVEGDRKAHTLPFDKGAHLLLVEEDVATKDCAELGASDEAIAQLLVDLFDDAAASAFRQCLAGRIREVRHCQSNNARSQVWPLLQH